MEKLTSKIIAISLLLFLVSACSVNNDDANFGNDSATLGKAKAICLDGIQYWVNGGQFAIRIDPETLKPKRCVK
ncbi:MAG: hypothetical protein DSZ27_02585 [Thiomicrospira sp.]|nr:MAG: hypothetical protein DSZ27_02585 [Thiomicrospira sp.]